MPIRGVMEPDFSEIVMMSMSDEDIDAAISKLNEERERRDFEFGSNSGGVITLPDIALNSMTDEDIKVLTEKLNAERERRAMRGVLQKAEKISQLCEELNDQGFEVIFKSGGHRLQYAEDFEAIVVRVDD